MTATIYMIIWFKQWVMKELYKPAACLADITPYTYTIHCHLFHAKCYLSHDGAYAVGHLFATASILAGQACLTCDWLPIHC